LIPATVRPRGEVWLIHYAYLVAMRRLITRSLAILFKLRKYVLLIRLLHNGCLFIEIASFRGYNIYSNRIDMAFTRFRLVVLS